MYPGQGLVARNPYGGATVSNHVLCGGYKKGTNEYRCPNVVYGSPFVSFSTELAKVHQYINEINTHVPGGFQGRIIAVNRDDVSLVCQVSAIEILKCKMKLVYHPCCRSIQYTHKKLFSGA